MGRDKSAPIAALRQAKIYPPGELRQPQSMYAHGLRLMDCGSSPWIAEANFEGSCRYVCMCACVCVCVCCVSE